MRNQLNCRDASHIRQFPYSPSYWVSRRLLVRARTDICALSRQSGTPQIPGLTIVYLSPLGDPTAANRWENIIIHQMEGPAGAAKNGAQARRRKDQRDAASRFGSRPTELFTGRCRKPRSRHMAMAPIATTINISPTSRRIGGC